MLLKLLTHLNLVTSGAALVLKDNVGKLPALGWNSWNAYYCDITESQFLSAANKFIELGLKVRCSPPRCGCSGARAYT